jgi:head-tail adaptor
MFTINPGELRTKIRIQKSVKGIGSFSAVSWVDLGNNLPSDPPRYILSKWEGLKGIEMWTAESLQALDTAKITIRFKPGLNTACRILNGDTSYQIVDLTDQTQHQQWQIITVKAAVMG